MNKVRLALILITILLSACVDKYRLKSNQALMPLAENEAYLSLVIDTLDDARSLEMLNVDTGKKFFFGGAKSDISQITLRLAEGEYCFVGFRVWKSIVNFKEDGFCTYAEAGELNYFGDFRLRDPVSTIETNFPRFVNLLQKEHPELCAEYIGEECLL